MPLDPLNNINQATHISVALYIGARCFSPKLRAGRKIHLHVDFSLDRFLLKQSCKFGCPLAKNGNNSRTTEVGKGWSLIAVSDGEKISKNMMFLNRWSTQDISSWDHNEGFTCSTRRNRLPADYIFSCVYRVIVSWDQQVKLQLNRYHQRKANIVHVIKNPRTCRTPCSC